MLQALVVRREAARAGPAEAGVFEELSGMYSNLGDDVAGGLDAVRPTDSAASFWAGMTRVSTRLLGCLSCR